MNAIDLCARELGRMVETVDYRGDPVAGRLDAIEIHRDERHRVMLRVATQEPINKSDGGGWYWSTWGECAVNRDAEVHVGDVAPDEASP